MSRGASPDLMPTGAPGSDFDYLAAIGMPPEFVQATSGDFLGRQAIEQVGVSAASTTVEHPFGDEFFVAPVHAEPIDASGKKAPPPPPKKGPTPAKHLGDSFNPDGSIKDARYSSPD